VAGANNKASGKARNMATEIERKYLIDQKAWQEINKPEGKQYRQGYLTIDPGKTIRVRVSGRQAFLTVKGETAGASRTEIECEIPVDIAVEMLEHFAIAEIQKIRYIIPHAGKDWEVDEFLGENAGLFIAELELKHEDEPFEKPAWVREEVTYDHRYFNSYISLHPYNTWHDQ
jgi:adenylate cyclase